MQNGNSDLNGGNRPPLTGLMRTEYITAKSQSALDDNSNTPAAYWGMIKRGMWWLTGFGLLGIAAGFVAVLFQDPLYHAASQLELQGVNESFMGMNAVDPLSESGNYSVNQANINTQLRIIESGSIRLPVFERLSRETTPAAPPARTRIDKLRQRLRRTAMNPVQEMRMALGNAAFSLKAKSLSATRIITISCDSTIPEIASDFVNGVSTEYMAQTSQQRISSAQKTSQWLESILQQTKEKLDQAEARMREFVRQSGIVGSQQEVPVTLPSLRLNQLTTDLVQSQQDRIQKQAKYDAVNEMVKRGTTDVIPEIADSAVIKQSEPLLADAKRRYDELITKLTPANPKVQAAQDEINRLQTILQNERRTILARSKNDYDQALAKEEALKKAYSVEQAAVSGQQDKASEYGLLKREVDLYKQTLGIMLQQVNQSSLVSAVPTNNVRVIDAAFPPYGPYKPDATYFMFVGGSLGLAAGASLVFFREREFKRKSGATFAVPGSAPSVLAVPELGVIPSAELESTGQSIRRRLQWLRGGTQPVLNADLGERVGAAKDVAAFGWLGKSSLMAEPFRLLITSLVLMRRNGDRPRTLVVSSPGPGEGKTTVASNLAIAMAETGQKVLLIDMDLRRPRLHSVFDLPNDCGFSDVVRGESPMQVTEDSPVILRTKVPGVSILPGGKIEVEGISELFHSPRVPALLRQLKNQFDTVIIDTAPILQFSESRFIASFADGVILVLRAGVTDRDSAIAVREQLSRDGIQLLGTILNDWNPKLAGASPKYASYYAAANRKA